MTWAGDIAARHAGDPLVHVDDLTVAAGGRTPLSDVSLTVAPGERLGIIGASGAGKTTLALALLGALRPGLRHHAGQVHIAGRDILAASPSVVRAMRRHLIAYLPQDPAASLTPTLRVGAQVAELAGDPRPEAVAARLRAVGLPDDHAFRRRIPGELSGGQQQRLALARALASDPQLLVLDEPTTGLDAHARETVVSLIDRIAREGRIALVVVSHDLAVVARLTDQLLVLRDGRIVERSPTSDTLRAPSHSATALLIDAMPDAPTQPTANSPTEHRGRPALEVEGVCASHGRGTQRTAIVTGVSFAVDRGRCLALVGRSGSGKTTIARCLAGLHPPTAGTVRLGGDPLAGGLRRRPLAQRHLIQLIAQDPGGSLNPRRAVGASVARPLRRLHGLDAHAADREARHLLGLVGLPPAVADRRPGRLSGGEQQRVAIARALAARPNVLVCDECTAALDPPTQAAILALLDDLRHRLHLAIVLIAHDPAVVARAADRILVLRDGRVQERHETTSTRSAVRHVLDTATSSHRDAPGRSHATP